MRKQQLPRVAGVKIWEGMNILNSLLFFKEAYQREEDIEKKEKLEKKFMELKLKLKNYKAA
ncbi:MULTISPECIES: hypothetical protein [Clostridium]|uniref:Uncharacterized protein n=1 Tax=Clostridium frigoriphilum TaxID=443253 RepID=A0ABU7UU50_9CLOT|nr:hypothetical protein [Clostridium sp. DSM 17811]MBU3098720.1 hypothetical protein [Clostridium sp. DSM 17811]